MRHPIQLPNFSVDCLGERLTCVFETHFRITSVFLPSNLLYMGCLMEFYTSLTLFYTKMSFENPQILIDTLEIT
jgi:hypothetical protein